MSAQTLNILNGLPAAADYSATPYRFMSNNNAQQYARSTSLTAPIAGVLLNKPKLGETAEIATAGIVLVEAGAAVVAGVALSSDATGRAITAVVAAGNYVGGVAIDAASGAGEIIRVQTKNYMI